MKAYREFMKGKKPDKKHRFAVFHGVKGMVAPPADEECPVEPRGRRVQEGAEAEDSRGGP
eukprot:14717843-Alexandrium_andersonii.AAC.1